MTASLQTSVPEQRARTAAGHKGAGGGREKGQQRMGANLVVSPRTVQRVLGKMSHKFSQANKIASFHLWDLLLRIDAQVSSQGINSCTCPSHEVTMGATMSETYAAMPGACSRPSNAWKITSGLSRQRIGTGRSGYLVIHGCSYLRRLSMKPVDGAT